ncbi:hypothetical protein [Leptospira wolffii]|uniref:hypothetical protein n=1 Tax=Leptospira wolffii TaxID=409998 RepID=UPI00030CA1EB|nr:hypothetical protein [Leptospira wolffii]EPG67807.1 hypothetical protein LEP1GSC061_0650 [Leptospira wolffii serovar Khorat str. Khorat-H2]
MYKIAVLGLGYVGRRIFRSLKKEHDVLAFSGHTLEQDSRLADFSDPEVVRNFSSEFEGSPFDFLILTFPIHNLPSREELLEVLPKVAKRFWLLGTTSIYVRNGSEITEATPLDPEHERFAIEKRFLSIGGRILRLSGIYGPDRNPADWIRKGKVQKTKRQLNLIHGDDIAEAVRGLLSYPGEDLPGEFVLADNQWHTWLEIFRFLEDHGKIPVLPEAEIDREDGFVDPSLIRKFLPGLQTKDFWRELEKLERLP